MSYAFTKVVPEKKQIGERHCMRYIISLLAILVATTTLAQEKNITKEKWHWDSTLKQDTTAGYAQVVKVDNVLYISGLLAAKLHQKASHEYINPSNVH